MNKRLYGAVIRTRKLDGMRKFLSETIGLGQPVVDSSFWLEYELAPSTMVLAVAKDETAPEAGAAEAKGCISWCLSVDDLDAFETRMTELGFGPHGGDETPSGMKVLIFRDPDGNDFMAIQSQPSEA